MESGLAHRAGKGKIDGMIGESQSLQSEALLLPGESQGCHAAGGL